VSELSIRPKLSKTAIFFTAIFVVALGLFWTGNDAIADRIITLRYFLFALTGLAAFSTPYLLFPDKYGAVIQLGNLPAKDLSRYLLKKLAFYTWPVFLMFGVILFGDLNTPADHLLQKTVYGGVSLFLFSGLILFSLARYVKSGPDSQFWKESEKGRRLRQNMADFFKYPLDPGSIPSLMNTILIVLAGFLAIVAGALFEQFISIYAELFWMGFIFIMAIATMKKYAGTLVRDYYSSNAFFREFFGTNLKGDEAVVRREVDQLWWVPGKFKAHVWQFLVQLDRKVPSGRVVAAGHVLVWFIAYQRPDPEFLAVIWLLFALLHHLFTLLTIQPEMSPQWLLRWLGSTAIWLFSRFWMQLRWIIPLLLSMNAQLFVFGTPGFESQALVIGIFILTSLLVSAIGVSKLRNVY
jgi:hypothetical protein